MADRDDPELEELWRKFQALSGSRRDWENLIFKPEWPDEAASWVSVDDGQHSLKVDLAFGTHLQRGDMMEFVVKNQRGVSTGEALGRVDNIRTVKGYYVVKLIHLASSDPRYDEWALEHLNSKEDFEMHICKKDAGQCQVKPSGKKMSLFHLDTFRLMPIWMGVKVDYARGAVLREVDGLIDRWAQQEAMEEVALLPLRRWDLVWFLLKSLNRQAMVGRLMRRP